MVVVMIGLLMIVAFPSLRTFSGYNDDVDAASHLVRTYNKIRSQARRRNRSYGIIIDRFAPATPQGVMRIFEGTSPSCQTTAEEGILNGLLVSNVLFGIEATAAYAEPSVAGRNVHSGLLNWEDINGEQAAPLSLCISPNGATSQVIGAVATAVDELLVRVQRFEANGENAYRALGPSRRVRLSFATGARLELQ